MRLSISVFQSRQSAATAVSWNRKGHLSSRMLMEMDTSSALWAAPKRDLTYILVSLIEKAKVKLKVLNFTVFL